MRNTLLAVLIFFSLSLHAQTLPIDSFYTPGATWTEYSIYLIGLGESHTDARTYTIAHDSVIGAYTYHMVHCKFIGRAAVVHAIPMGYDTAYDGTVMDFGIVGGIRVAGQQVYFYRFPTPYYALINTQGLPVDSERMIYDYSVVTGDTVAWQTFDTVYGLTNVVHGTDTVTVATGVDTKRFIFDTSSAFFGENYWLQGIGSSHGFLGSHVAPGTADCISTRLLCYRNSSFSVNFPNSLPPPITTNCFDLSFLGVSVAPRKSDDIVMFPNPVSDGILLFDGSRMEDVRAVAVYDMTGREIQRFNDPFAKGKRQITLPGPGGMYFLKLVFPDNTSTVRKVVRL